MITFGSKFLGDFDPFDTCRKFMNGKGDEWVLNDRKLHFCILKRYQIKGVLIWYDAFPGFTLSTYSTKNKKKSSSAYIHWWLWNKISKWNNLKNKWK